MCFKCDEMDAMNGQRGQGNKRSVNREKVDRLSREITEKLNEIIDETGSPFFGMKMTDRQGEVLGAVAFGIGPVGQVVEKVIDALNEVGEGAGVGVNSNVIPYKPQGNKPGFVN